MTSGRGDGGDVHLPEIDAGNRPSRQGRWHGRSWIDRQRQLIVVGTPGQFRPAQIRLLQRLRQRQRQQEWPTLPPTGQTHLSIREHLNRLVLPDHRLIGLRVMRIRRLDLSGLGELLFSERGRGRNIGGELLAERLHTLTMERILAALGGGFQIPGGEPLPRCARGNMQVDEGGPQASRIGPQRLTPGERGGRESTEHDETHDVRGSRLFVGHGR